MRGSRPMTEASEFPAVTAPRMSTVRDLDAAVATCRACPRLVAWREEAGRVNAGHSGTGTIGPVRCPVSDHRTHHW